MKVAAASPVWAWGTGTRATRIPSARTIWQNWISLRACCSANGAARSCKQSFKPAGCKVPTKPRRVPAIPQTPRSLCTNCCATERTASSTFRCKIRCIRTAGKRPGRTGCMPGTRRSRSTFIPRRATRLLQRSEMTFAATARCWRPRISPRMQPSFGPRASLRPGLTNADFATFEEATIAMQRGARAGLTCALVDLAVRRRATTLQRYPTIVMPMLFPRRDSSRALVRAMADMSGAIACGAEDRQGSLVDFTRARLAERARFDAVDCKRCKLRIRRRGESQRRAATHRAGTRCRSRLIAIVYWSRAVLSRGRTRSTSYSHRPIPQIAPSCCRAPKRSEPPTTETPILDLSIRRRPGDTGLAAARCRTPRRAGAAHLTVESLRQPLGMRQRASDCCETRSNPRTRSPLHAITSLPIRIRSPRARSIARTGARPTHCWRNHRTNGLYDAATMHRIFPTAVPPSNYG